MTIETAALSPVEAGPPPITMMALFLKFLRFGSLAFGGPVAQIAMLRQALVEEEGWIEKAPVQPPHRSPTGIAGA